MKMMIIREKLEKIAKKKMEIPRGRVTRPPNHTREEINRPPSQIKNNSYSVIRTRDLDDLICTRCTPTNSVTFRSSSTLLVIAVVFVYKTQGY